MSPEDVGYLGLHINLILWYIIMQMFQEKKEDFSYIINAFVLKSV